jgi:hypothetical protein
MVVCQVEATDPSPLPFFFVPTQPLEPKLGEPHLPLSPYSTPNVKHKSLQISHTHPPGVRQTRPNP